MTLSAKDELAIYSGKPAIGEESAIWNA